MVGLEMRSDDGAGALGKQISDTIITLDDGMLNSDWRKSEQISDTLTWYRV
jgi:hypothetical protein